MIALVGDDQNWCKIKQNWVWHLATHNVFHSILGTQCECLMWPLGEDPQVISSHCLMYLFSDFRFLFLIQEKFPILSFVFPWIILYFWLFMRCMCLFIISTCWREIVCWVCFGALKSDCLWSVPALTVTYIATTSPRQSFLICETEQQLTTFGRVTEFCEVTPTYTLQVYSTQWNGSSSTSLIFF